MGPVVLTQLYQLAIGQPRAARTQGSRNIHRGDAGLRHSDDRDAFPASLVIGQTIEEPWITRRKPPSRGAGTADDVALADRVGTQQPGPCPRRHPAVAGIGSHGSQCRHNSGPPGSACVRWGYVPFPVSQLDNLYRNHEIRARQVASAELENLRRGYIGALDARHTVWEAVNSAVGGRDLDSDYGHYLVEFAP